MIVDFGLLIWACWRWCHSSTDRKSTIVYRQSSINPLPIALGLRPRSILIDRAGSVSLLEVRSFATRVWTNLRRCGTAKRVKEPPTPDPPGTLRAWQGELALRVRRHTLLKTGGICAFIWLFFIAYFHVLRNPVHPVTIMPLTEIDRWIPFQPQALAPYLSLWFYLGIGPGLLLTYRELIRYGLWIGALCLVGLACFYLWPTAVPPLGFDVSGHPGFAMLQGVDASGNACPSLHVATAIFTAIRVAHLLRTLATPRTLQLLNLAWFAAIAYSTLATKQHVVLDALAGAALGTIFALASLRLTRGD